VSLFPDYAQSDLLFVVKRAFVDVDGRVVAFGAVAS
jgi:hypothetical protein